MPPSLVTRLRDALSGDTTKQAAFLTFLSMVEFRVFVLLHPENLFELSEAARHVIEGTPYFAAFQNRLLGPYLVLLCSWMTGLSYESSHGLVLLVLVIAANLTAFAVFRRLTASSNLGFRYAVYFLCAFLAIQSDDWALVWDFIDMPVYLLFAYGVFARKPLAYFIPIFAVGILNKESALVIPLWLMIDAFIVRSGPRAGRLGARLELPARFWGGVLLAAAGGIYTKVSRELLFVQSSLESTDRFIQLPFFDNHWNILASAYRAAVLLLNPALNLAVVIHLAWILLGWFFVVHWTRIRDRYLSVFVVVVAMWAAVPVFGFFDETRQYLYLLPFVLMFDLAFRNRIVEPA